MVLSFKSLALALIGESLPNKGGKELPSHIPTMRNHTPLVAFSCVYIGLVGVCCVHTYPPYPVKSLGMYLLVTDDFAGDPVYHTSGNWNPQLYPYQQNAANVLYLTFINPKTMPTVPTAFANLAQTRGTAAQGAVQSNQVMLPKRRGKDGLGWAA
jgi:hypothetical protein